MIFLFLRIRMERMLPVSIGGDPDIMTVGKFLYCRNPNEVIEIRCACGFVVDDRYWTTTGQIFLKCASLAVWNVKGTKIIACRYVYIIWHYRSHWTSYILKPNHLPTLPHSCHSCLPAVSLQCSPRRQCHDVLYHHFRQYRSIVPAIGHSPFAFGSARVQRDEFLSGLDSRSVVSCYLGGGIEH